MSYGEKASQCCSVSVDDVSNGVSEIFLVHLLDFMNNMVWCKKAKTEDLMKGLDKFVPIRDVVAAVIFI